MAEKNVTKRALKLYNSYNPKFFPLCALQKIFQNFSYFFSLWMSAEIINALYEGKGKRELYLLVAAALFGILAVRTVAAVLDRAVDTSLEILENQEKAAFNRKTLSLDYDKLEDPDVRQIRRKIDENRNINDYGVIKMRSTVLACMDCVTNLIFSGVFFGEMLVLIAKAPAQWISIVLLAALAACVALTIVFQFRQMKKGAAYWDEIGEFMLQENRIDAGYRTLDTDNRIYRQQEIITKLYDKLSKDHRRMFSKFNTKFFYLEIPVTLFSGLTELCSYLIVCLYCALGIFPVGGLIKYVGYLWRITGAVGSLFWVIGDFRSNERFLETYLQYFDVRNDMYQGSLAVEKRSDKKFEISFRNVSFRYAGSDAFALKDVSLNLKIGERLAVVGMNGSGKTTFIKLLCRLYDPTEGEIIMNDFNIRKYDYRQYLDLFSVVFQDYNLLAMSLGSNVACGSDWDTAKAEQLLEEVGFRERYERMPKGLETPMYKDFDTDGVELSGGEAQKVALARALYRNTPFIILDEPTAALDPIAEAEIYAKFDEIVGNKTAIYISHRLSSCRFCDKIAVFHEGRIVQTGTHEELLADEKGKYYELWNAQAQYYA